MPEFYDNNPSGTRHSEGGTEKNPADVDETEILKRLMNEIVTNVHGL